MFLKGLKKLLSICILIFVTGCVTNEQKSKDLATVNHGTSSDDDIVLNSLPKEVPDFFVVAEIKSVNDQPIEFLEFKLKRFAGKNECQTWMSNNSTFVSDLELGNLSIFKISPDLTLYCFPPVCITA